MCSTIYVLNMFSCCYVASLLLGAFLLYCRHKIYDDYNDEIVELKKKETKLISRLLEGKAPDADFDPYAVCIYLAVHFIGQLFVRFFSHTIICVSNAALC